VVAQLCLSDLRPRELDEPAGSGHRGSRCLVVVSSHGLRPGLLFDIWWSGHGSGSAVQLHLDGEGAVLALAGTPN